MTDHKATPEQWAIMQAKSTDPLFVVASCVEELRARVEALEANSKPSPNSSQIGSSLVAQVATAISQCEDSSCWDDESVNWRPEARAVLARYARPAIEPVPVSERLPGPEDCLGRPWEGTDAGFCWWFYPGLDGWRLMVATRWGDGAYQNWTPPGATHWLPHHALPVPQQETDRG